MRKSKPYVSDKEEMKFLKVINELQKEHPLKAVTKKEIAKKMKSKHYRQIGRVFQKLWLHKKKKILKHGSRGQYWIPEYLEKKQEYLININKSLKKEINHVEKFLDDDVMNLITKLSIQETWARMKLLQLLEPDRPWRKWNLKDVFEGKQLKEWQNIYNTVEKLMPEEILNSEKKKLKKRKLHNDSDDFEAVWNSILEKE